MNGAANGSTLAREALHLLGDLDARHARAHQRLVHVEVDQAHLGVGDLRDRLPVDAHQLQERRQREARRRARRRRTCIICRSSSVIAVQRQRAEAHRGEDPLDQLRRRGPLARAASLERVAAPRSRCSRFSIGPIASWPLSLALLDLLERVPARAQPRHDAHVGERGAASSARRKPGTSPFATQRLTVAGETPGARGDLGERQLARLAGRARSCSGSATQAARRERAFPCPRSLKSPPVSHGAPLHLRPTAPLGERVLLPGDPGRALALAQALLQEPRMFNHHRGLWGYTGAAPDGEPLTIQATGMGGPSAAIVLTELIALGARRAIRVGHLRRARRRRSRSASW